MIALLLLACQGDKPATDSDTSPTEDSATVGSPDDTSAVDTSAVDTSTVDTTDSGGETGGVIDTGPLEGLALYGLLGWDGADFTYADGVVPYELATPLFSDYALKKRALILPEGGSFAYTGEDEVFAMPLGTRILKSFLYPADLRSPDENLRVIETRVLTLEEDGWEAEPWVWNADSTEATFAPSGGTEEITVTGLDGEPLVIQYLVPQKNQCIDCHELVIEEERTIVPIGTKARHLNRGYDHGAGEVNQLEHFVDLGWLTGLPELAEVPRATDARGLEGVDISTLDASTLDAAARDYLDINCAHCHNPRASEGVSSQLFLDRGTTDPFDLGVCKRPGSAGGGTGGLTYDIVPGDHTQSILWYRMETEVLGEMMPDLGRSVRHVDGVALVAAWIDGLEGSCEE